MAGDDPDGELRRSPTAELLARRVAPRLHGLPFRQLVRTVLRLEDGPFRSATARRLLAERHGVTIGAFAYGACFRPGLLPEGVTVGRYASMAQEVAVFRRNHPTDRLSMHPFFYNAAAGSVATDTIESHPLEIGADAWIGHQAIVLPGCRRIGIGAVVGAGAVVTRDVPDFAVVTGNPATVRRLRFADDVCDAVLRSRWWERSPDELLADPGALQVSLDAGWAHHPLLAAAA
jgi:acetyltransferase-like isoleucine patch superfamily enzyme